MHFIIRPELIIKETEIYRQLEEKHEVYNCGHESIVKS